MKVEMNTMSRPIDELIRNMHDSDKLMLRFRWMMRSIKRFNIHLLLIHSFIYPHSFFLITSLFCFYISFHLIHPFLILACLY